MYSQQVYGFRRMVHTVSVRKQEQHCRQRNRYVQGRQGAAWWAWEVSAATLWQKYQSRLGLKYHLEATQSCLWLYNLWGKDLRILKQRFSMIRRRVVPRKLKVESSEPELDVLRAAEASSPTLNSSNICVSGFDWGLSLPHQEDFQVSQLECGAIDI